MKPIKMLSMTVILAISMLSANIVAAANECQVRYMHGTNQNNTIATVFIDAGQTRSINQSSVLWVQNNRANAAVDVKVTSVGVFGSSGTKIVPLDYTGNIDPPGAPTVPYGEGTVTLYEISCKAKRAVTLTGVTFNEWENSPETLSQDKRTLTMALVPDSITTRLRAQLLVQISNPDNIASNSPLYPTFSATTTTNAVQCSGLTCGIDTSMARVLTRTGDLTIPIRVTMQPPAPGAVFNLTWIITRAAPGQVAPPGGASTANRPDLKPFHSGTMYEVGTATTSDIDGNTYTALSPFNLSAFCQGIPQGATETRETTYSTEPGTYCVYAPPSYEDTSPDCVGVVETPGVTGLTANRSNIRVPDFVWGVTNDSNVAVSDAFTIQLLEGGTAVVTERITSMAARESRQFPRVRPTSSTCVARVGPGNGCYHCGVSAEGWNDNNRYQVRVDTNNNVEESREGNNNRNLTNPTTSYSAMRSPPQAPKARPKVLPAVKVSGANVRSVTLDRNGKSTITLKGRNLGQLRVANVVQNNKPYPGIIASIVRRGSTVQVLITATSAVRPATGLKLQVKKDKDARRNHTVPITIRVAAGQAKPSVRTAPPAARVAPPAVRTPPPGAAVKAVKISGANVRSVTLKRNSKSTITLKGSNLGQLKTARVIQNNRPYPGVAARIVRRGSTVQVTITTTPAARPATNLKLQANDGRRNYTVPITVRVVVGQAKPSVRTAPPATRAAPPAVRTPPPSAAAKAVKISGANVRSITLKRNSKSTITLKGSNLGQLKTARVIQNNRPYSGVAAKIVRRGSAVQVTITTTSAARPATNLKLQANDGRRNYTVPITVRVR